ncbi:secernin-1-like [Mercenaria mercenaria]|uniref:secernin-1-like n=1 Tax=Mercenaria mercenaria TaxID=6596 RepID=UPI00234F917E|nr:secernin-1-like [Mercenaria mercenaria]
MTSENLTAQAQSGGFWKSEDGPINFSKAFSAEYPSISLSDKQMPDHRLQCAKSGLETARNEGKIDINTIIGILRDEASSINFVGELLTVGSQVSVISAPTSGQPSCYWFTATPNTKYSVFKPFIFCASDTGGNWIDSPSSGEAPRATFQTSIDRRHPLYKAHEKGRQLMKTGSPAGEKLQATMQNLKKQCVREVTEFLSTFNESDVNEVKHLFGVIAES